MKFRYIECGVDSPKVTEAFGHTFILNGDPVEITEERAIAKLSNNDSFEIVDQEQKEKKSKSK